MNWQSSDDQVGHLLLSCISPSEMKKHPRACPNQGKENEKTDQQNESRVEISS